VIDRYTRPEMAAVFSDETKYSHWLNIEILAVEARVERGEVPAEDLEEIKSKAGFDIERIADLERKIRHDVAAFIDNVAEVVGPSARHIHHGMTSSDLLDTALALQMRDAAGLLRAGLDRLIAVVVARAREHAETPMVFRTHGIHAEPGTFGAKLAGWGFELDRGRSRLIRATEEISVGKLSGAVGTYSQLPPEIEEFVCERLGLRSDEASTQVISRDRHAAFMSVLGLIAATVERIATEIRHLSRTEVSEVAEAFAEGEQKGSSAMPHKRNPERSERLTGLARLVRGNAVASLENVSLWHERDISHSSVERVIIPDSCIALDFMLAEAAQVIEGLEVFPERMRTNLEASGGLAFSQSVLLALVSSGMGRDEAYRLVQEAAGRVVPGTSLEEVCLEHPGISERLTVQEIQGCFDQSRYVERAVAVVERLEVLEV
jgi:adenylosuccinate lyase